MSSSPRLEAVGLTVRRKASSSRSKPRRGETRSRKYIAMRRLVTVTPMTLDGVMQASDNPARRFSSAQDQVHFFISHNGVVFSSLNGVVESPDKVALRVFR
jgi:hypothetical protein